MLKICELKSYTSDTLIAFQSLEYIIAKYYSSIYLLLYLMSIVTVRAKWNGNVE